MYINDNKTRPKFKEVYYCFIILNHLYQNKWSIISKQAMFDIQSYLRNFDWQSVRKNPFVKIVDQENKTIYEPVKTEEEILNELDKLKIFINSDQDFPFIVTVIMRIHESI